MSRRPPAQNAERTSQNQQTLKTLVKVESNKSCADCKRNKHPRWASWNLGVFICIRCSGIHRGMGTHISRVKSVDLDAWTDEQMQSMLKWGNARANKYWESKLQPGHVPAENKIENFIRTKYESKRWVIDGPMPDPATLDADGDDEVPLNIIQEKAKLDRSASLSNRTSSAPIAAPGPLPQPRPPAQQINLFDDEPPAPRPASVATPGARQPPPPQQTFQTVKQPSKPGGGGDSLLGFDFFGPSSSTSPPPRPSSAAASTPGTSSGPSRPDLKQSILSLYAAKPPQPAPEPQNQSRAAQSSGGGLDDAFASLSFSSASPQPTPQPTPSPFADLTSPTSPPVRSRPSVGGNFFSPKPAPANPPPVQPPTSRGRAPSSDGFGDFTAAAPTSPPPKPSPAPALATSTGSGLTADLFDFSSPSPAPAPAPAPVPPPVQKSHTAAIDPSPFNLSSPRAPSQPSQPARTPAPAPAPAKPMVPPSGLDDPWGSSDVWASNPAPVAAPPPAPASAPSVKSPPVNTSFSTHDDFGGWASATPTATTATATAPAPEVKADEEFTSWASKPSATPTSHTKPASGGGFGGGTDDLFSNVWE